MRRVSENWKEYNASLSQIKNELKRNRIEVLLERFVESSLPIGNIHASGFIPSEGGRGFPEEYAIIGKRAGEV